ncbi:uncharacterized protein LOC111385939, partial [Olea europaea var. sylvestris]|uniref:uncharacterized protein LOC111385939 n=1 Tax=Olea europaea var. sylvestris TaxID=158386 RepID=UPI000C1CF0F2
SLTRPCPALNISISNYLHDLQGDFKVQEDKKHRKKYESLGDSEKKLQFFSARQIACRLLGSRGYLCQKCWLPMEDCMCSRVALYPLRYPIRFWLYMHPKDFLRQNNTGKLLWKVFGVEAATLCLFGIAEHEEIMWNAFNLAGLTAYVVFHVALSCQSIIIISIHLWLFHNCTKWLHVSLRK